VLERVTSRKGGGKPTTDGGRGGKRTPGGGGKKKGYTLIGSRRSRERREVHRLLYTLGGKRPFTGKKKVGGRRGSNERRGNEGRGFGLIEQYRREGETTSRQWKENRTGFLDGADGEKGKRRDKLHRGPKGKKKKGR